MQGQKLGWAGSNWASSGSCTCKKRFYQIFLHRAWGLSDMARGLKQPRGRIEQAYQTATLSAVVAETMDPATSGTARATACSHCGTANQSEEGDECQEPPQHWRWPYWSIHITVVFKDRDTASSC